MPAILRKVARALPARARPPLVKAVAVARAHRHADTVVGSGLFDPGWYAAQAGCPADPAAAARHYLVNGSRTGHSPHPLFDPGYVKAKNKSIGRRNPLLAYLTEARLRQDTTHPLFDLEYYLAAHPEAAGYRWGPVSHYLQVGVREGHAPNAWFVPGPDEPGGLGDWVRARYREAAARQRPAAGRWTTGPPIESHRADIANDLTTGGDPPLVSVVVAIGAALTLARSCAEAVLGQTLGDLELILVHPAGTEEPTRLALGPVGDDARVRLVAETDQGESVAVARGIAEARGTWLAFCRPSALWHPRHLETVVARTSAEGAAAGFDVVERSEPDGRRRWSTGEATPARSRVRPQIEPSALVVRRDRLAECDGFDPSLARGAWYDLELRLGRGGPITLVPRVGVVDEADRREQAIESLPSRERPRLEIDVLESWNDVAVGRHLVDWDRLQDAGDPSVVSVVVLAHGSSAPTVRAVECVHDAAIAHPDGPTVEVIVLDNAGPTGDAIVLDSLARRFPDTVVHHEPVDRGFSLGNNIALGLARGSVVVFLSRGARVGRDWLGPLLSALEDPEVHGAQSLLVHPSGSIQSAGLAFPATGGIPHALLQGFPIEDACGLDDVTLRAATATLLAQRRRDVVALHGFDPLLGRGTADVDLGLRSIARRPGRFTVRPDSVVIHHEARPPEPPRDAVATRRILLDRHRGSMPGDDVRLWAGQGYEVVGHHVRERISDDHRVDVPEPVLARRPLVEVREGAPRLRWALKSPAPYGPNVELWGDTHFVRGVRLALERLGQQVVVDHRGEFDRDTGRFDDVVLVLRGTAPYRPAYGPISMAWLISHPELLSRSEAEAYDRVFAASEIWAERTSREWRIRIDPLLQATDPELFHPDRAMPDTGHPILFVGMERKTGRRPIVRDAVEAGLPLAIYGHGWENSAPPSSVQASNLPYAEVGAAYRRAGVVLNDHWEEMRVDGFVSNRLFDAAASGARVITDDVHGLDGLFGRSVQIAHDVDELRRLATAADPDAIFGDDAERRAVAQRVHAEHSFDARAQTLLEAALELRQARPQ